MTHSVDLRWSHVQLISEVAARQMLQALLQGKESFDDLVEALNGRTDTQFAEQLFQTATPTAEQIAQVTDVRTAMTNINTLYAAANLNAFRRLV